MSKSKEDLINYRIFKSEKALEAAKGLVELENYDGATNRLYYSAFYVVSAALLQLDVVVKTHSGVRSKFHELLVKNGRIKKSSGQHYNVLFSNRQDADYTDFIDFPKEEVEELLGTTKAFVEEIKKLLL
jgi:uncharacterized protein (UPF0332 family)